MKGKHLVIAVLGALFVALGFIFWIGLTGAGSPSTHIPRSEQVDAAPAAIRSDAGEKRGALTYDGGSIGKTIADRRVRDELRRRILAGWAAGDGEVAAAAKQGHLAPMPPDPDGGLVDPAYIQSVMREDMFPMARACYEDLLKRQPDAGGRVELWFKIVGDDKLGGLVEEVDLDGGAPDAIHDEKMNTCLRESLLSLAFRPPPNDGWVTIGYPIVFAPDGPQERDE